MRFISERACISALRLVIPRRRLLSSDHCRGEITADIYNPLPFRAHILRRRVIKPRLTAGSTCRWNYRALTVRKITRRIVPFFSRKSERSSPARKGFPEIRAESQSERGWSRLLYSEKIRTSFVLFSAYQSLFSTSVSQFLSRIFCKYV